MRPIGAPGRACIVTSPLVGVNATLGVIGIGFQVVAHPPRLNASRTAIDDANAERQAQLMKNIFLSDLASTD